MTPRTRRSLHQSKTHSHLATTLHAAYRAGPAGTSFLSLLLSSLHILLRSVDVIKQAFDWGIGALFGKFNGSLYSLIDPFIDLLKFFIIRFACRLEMFGKNGNRIEGTAPANRFLRAIAIRINHRVPSETEADGLDQTGLMLLTRNPRRLAHGITYCQHVITVYAFAAHIVGASLAMQFRNGRTSGDLQPHTILIVDNKVDDGEAIDFSHNERFVKRTAICGAIPHLAGDDLMGVAISDGEGRPCGKRQLTAHNGIATHKTFAEIKQVHGTAAPTRSTGFLAKQLSHDHIGRDTTPDGIAMFAIIRVDIIIRLQPCTKADDGGLLAKIEMTVAANTRAIIHFRSFLFKTANKQHMIVIVEQRLLISLCKSWRRLHWFIFRWRFLRSLTSPSIHTYLLASFLL